MSATSGRDRLAGKSALVTGAGTGIGRALALGLASEGAVVVVNDLDPATAAETAGAIETQGGRALSLAADLRDTSQIERMFDEVKRRLGHVDVLVNNAGVTGWAPALETTEALWDLVIDTNLKGTFFCSTAAARLMREAGRGGTIVNVSTVCAERAVENLVAYGASKAGIQGLTRMLAVELAPFGIRVNAFAPGATLTPRTLRDDPEYATTWGGVTPLGSVADPEDMLGPCLFLASDDSRHVTGQVFFVDGGWTITGKVPEVSVTRALARARDEQGT